MNPDPKLKVYRNAKYLQFIRDHHCLICGNNHPSAHHVRRHYWGAGGSQKPHDYVTLPLCEANQCHNPKVEKSFPVEALIVNYLMEYAKANIDKRKIIEALMGLIEGER